MMIGRCPKCQEQVQPFSTRCPHCLYDEEENGSDDGMGFWGWLIVIVVFCYFFFGMYE